MFRNNGNSDSSDITKDKNHFNFMSKSINLKKSTNSLKSSLELKRKFKSI